MELPEFWLMLGQKYQGRVGDFCWAEMLLTEREVLSSQQFGQTKAFDWEEEEQIHQ
jgi:hypothetical protein